MSQLESDSDDEEIAAVVEDPNDTGDSCPSNGSCNWLDVVRKRLFVCGLLSLLH